PGSAAGARPARGRARDRRCPRRPAGRMSGAEVSGRRRRRQRRLRPLPAARGASAPARCCRCPSCSSLGHAALCGGPFRARLAHVPEKWAPVFRIGHAQVERIQERPKGERMLSDADRKKAADILMNAEKDRKQAIQLSTTWPDITIEDSYAISTEVAKRKMAAGAKLIGHKVGLTSKAMQRSSNIDEPDYGHLLDDMMIADGAKIPHSNYCRPRVEIELAFIMGKPLKGPGVGLAEVLRATEYVVPAIEIVDARIRDPRKIFDTVADNGAAAGIVIGGRPVGPLAVDLRWVGGIMYKNSEIEETGVAA